MADTDASASADTKVAKKARKTSKPATHPKYHEMITAALTDLKSRTGSSRQAISKYVKANYTVGDNADVQLKLALKRMILSESITHTRGVGASGSFKLNKPRVEKVVKPKKPATKKKPAPKKAVSKAKPKKTPAKKVKKPAAKKPKAVTKKPVSKGRKVVKRPIKKASPKKTVKGKSKATKQKPKGRKGRK